jgi:hypothetical protein
MAVLTVNTTTVTQERKNATLKSAQLTVLVVGKLGVIAVSHAVLDLRRQRSA